MTKELFNTVSRAFKNDENPTYAVAIDEAERVYIVAELFQSYSPTMPKGRRNNGFLCAGIFELKDTGKGCCTVKPIQTFGHVAQAKAQFGSFAQDMQRAENDRTLKVLLKNVHVEDEALNKFNRCSRSSAQQLCQAPRLIAGLSVRPSR